MEPSDNARISLRYYATDKYLMTDTMANLLEMTEWHSQVAVREDSEHRILPYKIQICSTDGYVLPRDTVSPAGLVSASGFARGRYWRPVHLNTLVMKINCKER